jgi:integrase
MQPERNRKPRSVSGHIYLKERAKGPVWYRKVRLPDGTEERKAIGPAWTGTGRTPDGYYTKRTAQAALDARLTDLRRGIGLPTRTGATFRDAAEAWYLHGTTTKGWKASTRRDYRSALNAHLLPAFGDQRLEDVTGAAVEEWRARGIASGELPPRTADKMRTILHAIYERACKTYSLPRNPIDDVEKIPVRYTPEDYDSYSVEEVLALVRAAASEQDAAIFLTAPLTGMRRGELIALRVRDVDFDASTIRVMGSYDYETGLGTTKGGRGRSVPMLPEVAQVLARTLQREHLTGRDDPVFVSPSGGHISDSALRRRYDAALKRAGLRPLPFHSLRHVFGTQAINAGSSREVQEWLGHADARTTARYVHYKQRSDEAQRLAGAFRIATPVEADAAAVEARMDGGGDDA